MQSTLQTPLQLIATRYRKDNHQTQRTLRHLVRKIIQLKQDPSNIQEVISSGKQQILNLKRKLSESCNQQMRLYDICKKRVHYQQECERLNDREKEKEGVFQAQILQFLCSGGDLNTAASFLKVIDKEALYRQELSIFMQIKQLEAQIRENRLEGIAQWVDDNSHNIHKIDNIVQFDLMCCLFINLVMQDRAIEACMHMRNKLKDKNISSQQHKQIQKLTYLLIDCQSRPPQIEKYLQRLRISFRKAVSQIYLISFDSPLQRKLAIGLSALKTTCCTSPQLRNSQICPLCSGQANKLCAKVPMLTKQSSSLICRINQTIMDQQNYPIALPNGQIYSRSGLVSTANEGSYFCQVTQTWYPIHQSKKVFLA